MMHVMRTPLARACAKARRDHGGGSTRNGTLSLKAIHRHPRVFRSSPRPVEEGESAVVEIEKMPVTISRRSSVTLSPHGLSDESYTAGNTMAADYVWLSTVMGDPRRLRPFTNDLAEKAEAESRVFDSFLRNDAGKSLDRTSFPRSSGGPPTEVRRHSRVFRTLSTVMASMSYRHAVPTFYGASISEQVHFIRCRCFKKTSKPRLPTTTGSASTLEIRSAGFFRTSRRVSSLGRVVGGPGERLSETTISPLHPAR